MLGAPTAPLDPPLPLARLTEVGVVDVVLAYPPVKALLPLPILALVAWPIYRFFRATWADFDREAAEHRGALVAEGGRDTRPAAALLITAVVLTLQEYYGGRPFYDQLVAPGLRALESWGFTALKVQKYDELWGYAWWVGARVIGYVLIPFPLWKLLYPRDSLLDLGFRVRGLLSHAWIYGVCLAVVVPTMLVVANQADFGTYYPFYKASSRSWFDFLAWEALYFLQFFALEAFFRGWLVGALRPSLGSASVFVMTVPYCMIHYGKPYLEAHGAIVAGVVLGSLALRTRSIYSGFLLHITVAFAMDFLALWKRGALPTTPWAPG